MMTRRERLMATLRGQPVDRPAVSFYELGGWKLDPDDPDPFNVYNGPGWRDLLRLAEEETDLIRMMAPETQPAPGACHDAFFTVETTLQQGVRFTRETLTVAGRTLTSCTRRDPEVATTWVIEPLLKDPDDVRAYMALPDDAFAQTVRVDGLLAEEEALGDAGIIMIDIADPLCRAASLFSLEDYTVFALTEPMLFHQLLEQHARYTYPLVETVAQLLPGRLWRVVGSEYASEPLLPPRLYEEYEVRYTRPIVNTIQRHGGYARIHSHGRLRAILPLIASMEPAGLDPVEPPPQGDMTLLEVRQTYGKSMVLFGNIEASEIETLPNEAFAERVHRALQDGTTGEGRGFVLMPSSCPYGREISPQVMANYETMVRLAQGYQG